MLSKNKPEYHYIPLSALDKALNFVESHSERSLNENFCSRNLRQLQSRFASGFHWKPKSKTNIVSRKLNVAVTKAIYAHDWDKVLCMLKMSPIWEHMAALKGRTYYTRALAILFMNHPNAKTQNLLREYIHMCCSCRTDEEKNALMKLILTLPEKIVIKDVYAYQKKPLIPKYAKVEYL